MHKIKIIDLLNKIANGEEIPEEIRFEGKIFEKQDETSFYCTGFGIFEEAFVLEDLNKEVEIIDDEYKEIKPLTKQDIEALGYACGEIKKCFTNGWNKSLENKSFKEDKQIQSIDVEYYKTNDERYNELLEEIASFQEWCIDKVNSLEKEQ